MVNYSWFSYEQRGIFSFPNARFQDVSTEAKDLIRKMLQVNITDRYSASEVLEHPWILPKTSTEELSTSNLNYIVDFDYYQNLPTIPPQPVMNSSSQSNLNTTLQQTSPQTITSNCLKLSSDTKLLSNTSTGSNATNSSTLSTPKEPRILIGEYIDESKDVVVTINDV
jgi:serine/threonine protein kinase